MQLTRDFLRQEGGGTVFQFASFPMLTLVEGDEVLIYSNADPPCCFHQKFMDVIVVPACMGEYGIINLGVAPCKVHKTLLK